MSAELRAALAEISPRASAAAKLRHLQALGLDELPMPGSGRTLARFQALAAVGRSDLALAKLYEGHTDALAIVRELGCHVEASPDACWGVWAAEGPRSRVILEAGTGAPTLHGTKQWCSGARAVSHALVTAWSEQGAQLVAVALDQPGLDISSSAIVGPGMAASETADITFHGATCQPVGATGAYLSRSGFWHGGAGVAACWYGGATAVADALRGAAALAKGDAFARAALGKVELWMHGAAAALREAARFVDAQPEADSRRVVYRARLATERAALRTLELAGGVLGPAAYCRDAAFARMAADLTVFVRQSHGDHDLAALGELVALPSAEAYDL